MYIWDGMCEAPQLTSENTARRQASEANGDSSKRERFNA